MSLHIIFLLACPYSHEIQERKRLLLLLHISRLRSSMQELLDSMMPRSVAQRAHAAGPVVNVHERAAVLVCGFPGDAAREGELLGAFLLLDRAHAAFDALLAGAGAPPLQGPLR
jgi:hypothetical protein